MIALSTCVPIVKISSVFNSKYYETPRVPIQLTVFYIHMVCFFFSFSLLETEDMCPMCSERVKSGNLKKIDDPSQYLHPDVEDD